jgi:hypothetical protein
MVGGPAGIIFGSAQHQQRTSGRRKSDQIKLLAEEFWRKQ